MLSGDSSNFLHCTQTTGVRRVKITSGNLGAKNELVVAIDLIEKGFNVFRSLTPNAPFDLVAYRNKQLYRIEVKTARLNLDGTRRSQQHLVKTHIGDIDAVAWVMPNKIEYQAILSGLELSACPKISHLKYGAEE